MQNFHIYHLNLLKSFSKIKTKVGPQGPRGYRGDKGYIGKVDSCAVCGPQQNTFAYENLDKMKKELVIPQKPLLKKIDIQDKENFRAWIADADIVLLAVPGFLGFEA